MSNNPFINILILNWNGAEILSDCVKSVLSSDYTNYKITIIDNGSTDNSIENLLKSFDGIDVIKISKNLGYARGYNYAFSQIQNQNDDYYLLLNNDTIVKKNTLTLLVKASNYYGSNNVYGPKIINFNNEKNWYCGGKINIITGNVSHRGINKTNHLTEFKTNETVYVSGCCMLISKKMINSLNGFNEVYKMYYEDVDLCFRLKRKNNKCYFISESIIYHKVSYSIGGQFALKKYYSKFSSFLKFLYINNNFLLFLLYLLINIVFIPFYIIILLFKRLM